MKKLGLVGGMGPQSTVPYYMGFVYGVRERTSPDFFPKLSIESVNVFEVLQLIEDNRLDDLIEYLLKALENLHAAGVEVAALTANTAHIVYHRLKTLSPMPLISIVEATADEAQRRGYTRIALLGTSFTMERDFYKEPFIRKDIEIIVPDATDRDYINATITNELELGIVKTETLERYRQIIERLKNENGIEAVILGCTELPMLLSDSVCPVPVLDTVKIHTAALIHAVLD